MALFYFLIFFNFFEKTVDKSYLSEYNNSNHYYLTQTGGGENKIRGMRNALFKAKGISLRYYKE